MATTTRTSKTPPTQPHAFHQGHDEYDTRCLDCNLSQEDPIHQVKHLPPVLMLASYLSNELNMKLMVGQMVVPGESPDLVWYINTEGFELAEIHVNEDGSFDHWKFNWGPPTAQGYDVIPFLVATINWLTEGK